MRMRTIPEAYKEIKTKDPNTCVTKSAFRRMVKTGCIPSIPVGSKTLVAMENVEAYFENGLIIPEETPVAGKIRPVKM